MWESFGKAIDWAIRTQFLAILVWSSPAAFVAVVTALADMRAHEIILFTSAALALCMISLYYGDQLLGWWGERKERGRVVEYLRERQAAGDATIPLLLVATAWHGKDADQGSLVERSLWNAKFRRLKRAVTDGQLKGTVRDNMASDADVADLIRYFSSRPD